MLPNDAIYREIKLVLGTALLVTGMAGIKTGGKTRTIKFYVAERGYGCIGPDDDSPDVFVHASRRHVASLRYPGDVRRTGDAAALHPVRDKPERLGVVHPSVQGQGPCRAGRAFRAGGVHLPDHRDGDRSNR